MVDDIEKANVQVTLASKIPPEERPVVGRAVPEERRSQAMALTAALGSIAALE